MLLPDVDENATQSPEIQVLKASLDSYRERFEPHDPLILDVVRRLAVAYWRAGEAAPAVSLLDQTLEQLTLADELDQQSRSGLLNVLWKILFEHRLFNQAAVILREEVECRQRHDGPFDPEFLIAQADLATVLFDLGGHEEAEALERKAFENARTHLGKTHTVSCVLAWNRVLTSQRRGDHDSARRLATDELAWLLAADESRLDHDQLEIREAVAKRLNWCVAQVQGRTAVV